VDGMETDRSARLTAYREVRAIAAELHGTKLHDAEAAVIEQAAEDLLLAATRQDPHAQESYAAFVTLMDDLESHRWEEHGATADRLRVLVLACAPDPPLVGSR
jgi:hypothetical protein